jgi:hypothetical protein
MQREKPGCLSARCSREVLSADANSPDRVTRWSTAFAVLGVTAVTAVASYEHAYDQVRATSRLHPVDGMLADIEPALRVGIGRVEYANKTSKQEALIQRWRRHHEDVWPSSISVPLVAEVK